MADVSERFRNALREAMAQAIDAPPPPLASDVRVRERRRVPIPKTFRDLLGLIGGESVQLKADSHSLELRPHPHEIPDQVPDIDVPQTRQGIAAIRGALTEAFSLDQQERYGIPLLIESPLNSRGYLTLDPLAWHRLGWQAGDRVRVVLEEGYLRLIRLDQPVRDARLNAS